MSAHRLISLEGIGLVRRHAHVAQAVDEQQQASAATSGQHGHGQKQVDQKGVHVSRLRVGRFARHQGQLSSAIDVLVCQLKPFGASEVDEASGSVWRDRLPTLVKADIRLAATHAGSNLVLRDAETQTDSLHRVHWLGLPCARLPRFLWPIQMPVIGPQFAPRNYTSSCMLNLHTSANRDGPLSPSPLAYGRLLDAKLRGQLFLATNYLNCFDDRTHKAKV